jgi:hypothetical protein
MGKNLLKIIFVGMCTCIHAQNSLWEIKNVWNSQWESLYSDFIEDLGESSCSSAKDCINSAANPYRNLNPNEIKSYLYSDCADLPYVLRAYFAFVNKLPFHYSKEMNPITPGGDLRYSKDGNYVYAFRNIIEGENVVPLFQQISEDVTTAQFRMQPQFDAPLNTSLFPDFYSPAINYESIQPGTNVYDSNGHAAIVYKVETNGRILMMDAHPDNSISRIVYGKKFARSRPTVGAGFKNWRPYNYDYIAKRNNEINNFSLEQYYGNYPDPNGNWENGKFVIQGQEYDYYDYVRIMMAGGHLQYDPLEEFRFSLRALCADIKDRAQAVENAIKAGMAVKAHSPSVP